MLKVWIWRNRGGVIHGLVSPTEPEKVVSSGGWDYYHGDGITPVCLKYLRRITGRAPTLKPRAYILQGHQAEWDDN